ncbi:MAG: GDSL family lipase, partial [Burkholderiales bacterium]
MKQLLTRRWLAPVFAAAVLLILAACGSGTIENQLTPKRFVVFGDARADVGQSNTRYTVNDGSVNTWVEQTAADYKLTIAPASQGGTGYARGNARVVGKP